MSAPDRPLCIAAGPFMKIPHLGDCALTRDLWWCECGRGLGENVNLIDIHLRWRFCPRCGALLDWHAAFLSYERRVPPTQSTGTELNTPEAK